MANEENKSEQIKGNAKESVGNALGDKELEQEGQKDKAAGKAKEAVEKAKDKANEAIDKLSDKLDK
jgi:uncharacterized protein YjbJ (UPF0337 family)